MSKARSELLMTLESLETAVKSLGQVDASPTNSRSPKRLALNGMLVITFAALEDFIRQRVVEVLNAIFAPPLHFEDAPDLIQTYILQEWVRGVNAQLQRRDPQPLSLILKQEAEMMGTTVRPQHLVISDYVFGRSQSNISLSQIGDLFCAFGISDTPKSLAAISDATKTLHLGRPDQIFSRISETRNSCAHGFSNNSDSSALLTDLEGSIRATAIAVDTCISHAAALMRFPTIRKDYPIPFATDNVKIRIVQFNALSQEWDVYLDGDKAPSISKTQVQRKIESLKKAASRSMETLLQVDHLGKITDWNQPI